MIPAVDPEQGILENTGKYTKTMKIHKKQKTNAWEMHGACIQRYENT